MGGKTISSSETRIEALKLQSSAYGVTIPLVFGLTRITGNLIDYNGFRAIPHTTTQGGKGGSVKVQSTTFTYQASVVMGLCHGTIAAITKTWRGKNTYTSLSDPALGLTLKTGALGQTPWAALAAYSGKSLGYSGLALVAADAYDLGAGAQVENHLFEVQAPLAYHLGVGVPDVDTSLVVSTVLSQVQGGAGFPTALLDSWTDWSNYCCAAGLLVSPNLDQQQPAADVVRLAADLTNTAPVWSGGVLKMVPYADTAESGNAHTFTPNTTPVYDLTDDSYTPSNDVAPIGVKLKSPADRFNHWRVEFLNRNNAYNVEISEAKDQADIDANGLRTAPTLQAHWICDPVVARKVVQIKLQRSLYVCAEYTVPLPEHYALIECADLLTLTDTALTMAQVPVRVTVIEEADDGGLTVTAEDYPAGTASAALYASQAGAGFQADYNAAPGSANAPVIFEAPGSLTVNGLEVYVAATGTGAAWGGCHVWVSLDGTNYKQVGTINGGSRYGTLSASCGSSGVVPVALLKSSLLSGSVADAAALNTLCFVRGSVEEYFAYQTATLTSALHYDLGGSNVRGAYGTAASAHPSGATFVRVDDAVARSGPIDLGYVGRTIHVKLTSFNIYGGGEEQLSGVTDYTYAVTGARVYGNAGAAALAGIGVIADDNILAAGEKPPVILEYTRATTEQSGIDAQATSYGITTEKTAYDNAVSALTSYLGGLTTPLAWNNLTGDTTIVGATFRSTWAAFYAARQALLNKFDASSKALADNAQTAASNAQTAANNAQTSANTANSAISNIVSDNVLSKGEKGAVILDWTAIDNEYSFITSQAASYGVGSELTNYVAAKGALATYLGGLAPAWNDTTQDTTITGATFRAKFADVYFYRQAVLDAISGIAKTLADNAQIDATAAAGAASAAGIAASNAQTDANTANAAISNISSDNVLSKGEKGQVILDWAAIAGEQAGIDAQAGAYSITTEKTTYDTAVAALSTYLSGLSPAWNDTTTDTAITATTFRSKFADVYTTRQALLNKIAAVAGTLATWASVSGTGKPADNATVGAQFGVNITGQAATADVAAGAITGVAQVSDAGPISISSSYAELKRVSFGPFAADANIMVQLTGQANTTLVSGPANPVLYHYLEDNASNASPIVNSGGMSGSGNDSRMLSLAYSYTLAAGASGFVRLMAKYTGSGFTAADTSILLTAAIYKR